MKIENKDMTPILLEDLGRQFTSDTKKYKARYGLYQCQYCGNTFKTKVSNVNTEVTKSCGCYQKQLSKENNVTHGLKYHPLYNTWSNMKKRCYNIDNKYYNYYGGRGIKVCDRWLDIKNFVEDMYPSYQEGLSLDRIDANGNYEPDNCRWATRNTQSQNTRDLRIDNKSGYRGVNWHNGQGSWVAQISVEGNKIHLGYFNTTLEAAKAYESYVRLNNLEHNFTPALTEEELNKLEGKN